MYHIKVRYKSQFKLVPLKDKNSLFQPICITTASNGDILVVGSREYGQYDSCFCVQIFNSEGVYKSQFGTKKGKGDGQLYNPSFIATASNGNILVTDTGNNRVQIFNSEGDYLSQFGTKGDGDGQFLRPYGITTTSNGDIVVVDAGNNRVQIFNSKGVYKSQFGTKGKGDLQFKQPIGITISSYGDIWVTDTGNHRVQISNSSSAHYLRQFEARGTAKEQFEQFLKITGIITTNYVLIVDAKRDCVQIFNFDGEYQTHFGTRGEENGQFNTPLDIAIASNGDLLVTDSRNHRVQRFSYSRELS